jgi:hypothetical protein
MIPTKEVNMEREDNGNNMMRVGAPITGVLGTVLGGGAMLLALAAGGMGLFGGGRRNTNGPSIEDRIAALEAGVAVNTQRDIDMGKQTELMIENAKLQAKLDVKESEAKTTALITAVNNQGIVSSQRITCLENDLNKVLQIGIPQASIIPTPSAAASTTAG